MRYRSTQSFGFGPIGFLIILNLIMFVATSIKPDLFIELFGLYSDGFLDKPWTIITNMFIHSPFRLYNPFGSIWHILANMWALYFFGSFVIRLVGEGRFLLTYFIGGIIGNLFFMLLGPENSIAIGASGAIFAIAGTLTIMRPRLPIVLFPIPVPMPLWVAVIGGFVLLTLLSLGLNVAWEAHLGGLLVGLVAGYIFRRRARSRL